MGQSGGAGRLLVRASLCRDRVQGADSFRAGWDVAVLATVLAVESNSVRREAYSRVVLFEPGHPQHNRVMGQLRYEEHRVLLHMVLNAQMSSDVLGAHAALGRASVENFDLERVLQGEGLYLVLLHPVLVNEALSFCTAVSERVSRKAFIRCHQLGWQYHEVRALVILLLYRDSFSGSKRKANSGRVLRDFLGLAAT